MKVLVTIILIVINLTAFGFYELDIKASSTSFGSLDFEFLYHSKKLYRFKTGFDNKTLEPMISSYINKDTNA